VPEKQTVNDNFIKRWLRDSLLQSNALGLSFRKVGTGIFYTTMHRRILRALSPSFWRNEGPSFIPSTLLIWFSAGWLFFISWIKNCDERDEIRGCSIDPTDCDERTEGDTGRSVFSGMSDVNVVKKRAGTLLSDSINKHFFIFCMVFYGLSSGT
jgi:hypothetical protein